MIDEQEEQFSSVMQVQEIEFHTPTKVEVYPSVMLAAIPGTYGELTLQSQTTWEQLLQLWDCIFLPCNQEHIKSPQNVTTCILATDTPEDKDLTTSSHLLLDHCQRTSLFFLDGNTTWADFSTQQQIPQNQFFDDVGHMFPATKLGYISRVSESPHPIQKFFDLPACSPSFSGIRIQARIPTQTDVLVVHFEGDSEQIVQLASFWHIALSEEWASIHGRKRCFQVLSDTSCQFLFPPHWTKCALLHQTLRNSFL